MFGAFRFVLATLVVWNHLFGAPFSGYMAVFGFYCLSGYLMTAIVNGPYADGLAGFARYIGNRALRIYPAYLAVVALVAAVMLLWPEGAGSQFNPQVFELQHFLPGIMIIGLFPNGPSFIAPAWTLHVELLHYIAIAALLGRSRLMTVLWFVAALDLRMFGPALGGLPLDYFYFSALGSSLPFAAGAMIWQFRKALPDSNLGLGLVAGAIFVAVAGVMNKEVGHSGGLNVGLVFVVVIIIALRDLPQRGPDRLLGALAYPVYLLHGPMARIVWGLTGSTGLVANVISVLATLAAAYLMVAFIDRPIEQIRTSLRHRRAHGALSQITDNAIAKP